MKPRGLKEDVNFSVGFNESRGPRIARGAQNFVSRGGRGYGYSRGGSNYNNTASGPAREDENQE